MMALCTEIIGVIPVKSRLHQNVDTFNVNRKQMLTNYATSKQVNLLMLLTPFSPLFNHNIWPITLRSFSCFENVLSYSHLRLLMNCPLTGQCLSSIFTPPPTPTHPPHFPTGAMSSLPLPAKSADQPPHSSTVQTVSTRRRKPLMGGTRDLFASLRLCILWSVTLSRLIDLTTYWVDHWATGLVVVSGLWIIEGIGLHSVRLLLNLKQKKELKWVSILLICSLFGIKRILIQI